MRLGVKQAEITKKIGQCAGYAGYSLFSPFYPTVQFPSAV